MRISCLSFTVDHAQQTHWLTHIQICKEAFYVSFSVHLNKLALLFSSHSILAVKSSSEAPMVSYLANRGTGRSSLHWSLITHSMELLWRLSSVDAMEAQWCRVDGRSNCVFLLHSFSTVFPLFEWSQIDDDPFSPKSFWTFMTCNIHTLGLVGGLWRPYH